MPLLYLIAGVAAPFDTCCGLGRLPDARGARGGDTNFQRHAAPQRQASRMCESTSCCKTTSVRGCTNTHTVRTPARNHGWMANTEPFDAYPDVGEITQCGVKYRASAFKSQGANKDWNPTRMPEVRTRALAAKTTSTSPATDAPFVDNGTSPDNPELYLKTTLGAQCLPRSAEGTNPPHKLSVLLTNQEHHVE